jgi:hypothetical protein
MTEKDEHFAEVIQSGRIDDAWERYLMTGDPAALSIYVSAGGDIDDEIREAIAAHLRGERPINYPNHSDNWKDYEVYSNINLRMQLEQLSNAEACRRYVVAQDKFSPDNDADPEGFYRELDRVRKQYVRGKKASNKGGRVYD